MYPFRIVTKALVITIALGAAASNAQAQEADTECSQLPGCIRASMFQAPSAMPTCVLTMSPGPTLVVRADIHDIGQCKKACARLPGYRLCHDPELRVLGLVPPDGPH